MLGHRGQRNVQIARQLRGLLGGGNADDVESLLDALADRLDRERCCRPAAQSDDHAAPEQRCSRFRGRSLELLQTDGTLHSILATQPTSTSSGLMPLKYAWTL